MPTQPICSQRALKGRVLWAAGRGGWESVTYDFYLLKHSPRMWRAVSKSKLSHLLPTSLIFLFPKRARARARARTHTEPYTQRPSLPLHCQEAVLLNSRPIGGLWSISTTATEKLRQPGEKPKVRKFGCGKPRVVPTAYK